MSKGIGMVSGLGKDGKVIRLHTNFRQEGRTCPLSPKNLKKVLTSWKVYDIINSESKGGALSPKGAECGLIERICDYDLDLDIGCGDPPKRRLYHPISQVDWLETVAMWIV